MINNWPLCKKCLSLTSQWLTVGSAVPEIPQPPLFKVAAHSDVKAFMLDRKRDLDLLTFSPRGIKHMPAIWFVLRGTVSSSLSCWPQWDHITEISQRSSLT